MVTARPLGLNAPSCCCPLSCVAPTVLWLRAGALASGASPWLFPHLPDFFQGKHFFLYGEFPGDERRKLSRYVTAFNGSVSGFGGGEGRGRLRGGRRGGGRGDREGAHPAGGPRPCSPVPAPLRGLPSASSLK